LVEPDSDIIQRRGSARAGTLRVIGLSLALAATLELLLVVDAAATGAIEGAGPFLLDLVQKLPWAVIVCTGVWLGLEVGRRRPVAVGLAGLLSAPIASLLARSVAETVHTVAFATAPAVGPFLIASIKGTQYACLGFALGWLGLRAWARAHHHAAAGLVAGLLFGGVLLVLTVVNSPESASLAQVGGWVINELLFPVGCSLIVFSVRDLAPSG
jgi:hypothetical protein